MPYLAIIASNDKFIRLAVTKPSYLAVALELQDASASPLGFSPWRPSWPSFHHNCRTLL